MAKKPTVYIDSNIFSVLGYRGGIANSIAQHLKTREWWDMERSNYSLFTSHWSEIELERGMYGAQKAALAFARRTNYLSQTSQVDRCMKLYLERRLVPASKFGDAIQLAFCTVYGLDYLLSWNHAHLVNDDVRRRLEELHKTMNWRTPRLVSPESIPWASLGQSLRRKDD